MRRHLVVVLLLALTTACASVNHREPTIGYTAWRAAVDDLGLGEEGVVYPFAVTPEMEAWAREVTSTAINPLDRLKRLQRALFDRAFEFAYDEDVTLTATDAFTNRRGNCLAFTSLFVALARSVGIPTSLVAVERIVDVEREETLVVVNRHVVAGYAEAGRLHLFDFFLTSEVAHLRQRVADDLEASGMYHTNLGARLLQEGRSEEALEQLERAVRLAPALSAAWVNLGVARRRAGDRTAAFAAYEQALEVEPGNNSALTNLAYLYSEVGRAEEARAALLAASRGMTTPFTLIALADAEMMTGHYEEAGRYLRKARRRYRATPEVYEALARLARYQDREERAERLLERANQLREQRR